MDHPSRPWGFALVRICLIAWPVSKFYGADPHTAHALLWAMPVIGFSTVISGFYSTSILHPEPDIEAGIRDSHGDGSADYLCHRDACMGMVQPSVWALVAGAIVYSAVRLPMSHWLNRPLKNKFCWKPTRLKNSAALENGSCSVQLSLF